MQCTSIVAHAVAGVRSTLTSNLKAMRRSKNQGSGAMAQQGNAPTIANTPSAGPLNSDDPGADTTQEHGVMDPDALLPSDLGSRTSCFGTNTTDQFSPIASQGATPTHSTTPPGLSPSMPPRPSTSGISGVTGVSVDLLDDQGTTASGPGVVGTLIQQPSPRQNTQSQDMHQSQQSLRDSANAQIRMHSNDSEDRTSAFFALDANDTLTVVETVLRDDLEEGTKEADPGNDARVKLSTKPLNTSCGAGSACESGLEDLVIGTNDPG